MNKNISNRVAYAVIVLFASACAFVVYHVAAQYYQELTTQYTMQGEAFAQLRTVAIQQRIGTGINTH